LSFIYYYSYLLLLFINLAFDFSQFLFELLFNYLCSNIKFILEIKLKLEFHIINLFLKYFVLNLEVIV